MGQECQDEDTLYEYGCVCVVLDVYGCVCGVCLDLPSGEALDRLDKEDMWAPLFLHLVHRFLVMVILLVVELEVEELCWVQELVVK